MHRTWSNSGKLLAAALGVAALAGCHSAPMTVAASNSNAAPPFTRIGPEGKVEPSIPKTITVPAGTPIAVRLQEPLSSETAQAGQKFGAVLDEPLVEHGVTVLPQGATITGRVLAVRRARTSRSGGILQLQLESAKSGNGVVELQTSSVIANARDEAGSAGTPTSAYARGNRVSVGAERRLTFRLRQPAMITAAIDQRSVGPTS